MVTGGFDSPPITNPKGAGLIAPIIYLNFNVMKINFCKWGSYHTPYFSLIPNRDYTQISFVVLNFHWWIIINKKTGGANP